MTATSGRDETILSAVMSAVRIARAQPIPARGVNLPYPLSSGQQRIWFFEKFAPGVPLYNESEAVRLAGELQAEAMEQALNLIIARHEVLRTTIQMAAERLIVIVHENWLLRMKRIDLSGLAPAQREAEVKRLVSAASENEQK